MSPLSVPKIFMAGGAVGFGYYLYMRQYWFPNPYKTQGVQNIEDRFSAGSSTDNEGRKEGGSNKGPDSEHFKSNHSSQHNDGVWPAKFYEQQANNPKGK
ncbi:hypothetical protein SLS59_000828 [Nothophoma quercina]|uniref:Uncharacterized protein n=1 Tax=Nothophoma quercina TaxID=749835 RepID=A0ABR3S4L5_9PLEO